jgi:hypothetical protein
VYIDWQIVALWVLRRVGLSVHFYCRFIIDLLFYSINFIVFGLAAGGDLDAPTFNIQQM